MLTAVPDAVESAADGSRPATSICVRARSPTDRKSLPGACFRNQEFAEEDVDFDKSVDYNHKMLMFDAQTSGGLFMATPRGSAGALIERLRRAGYPVAAIVGAVIRKGEKHIYVT